MIGAHALLAPSGWERWSVCAGAPALEATEPESDSEWAREGRAAHDVAAHWFKASTPPVGVDADMLGFVESYIRSVWERKQEYLQAGAKSVDMLIEQRVPIEPITGEKDAEGTADAILIADFGDHSVLEIDDLKYGRGIEVDVRDNGQLQLYALGAMHKYGLLHNFSQAVLRVHQPRVRETPLEWNIEIDELLAFAVIAQEKAALALQIMADGDTTALQHLNPGEVQCRFCRARHKCPALAKLVHSTVLDDFGEVREVQVGELLGQFMAKVPLIESWCEAVRDKAQAELLAGNPVDGFKLVEGRRGNRRWDDEAGVEKILFHAHVSPAKMFAPKVLLSPTKLEKVLKSEYPNAWREVRPMIVQDDGKPVIAPNQDNRPPWTPKGIEAFETFDAGDLV